MTRRPATDRRRPSTSRWSCRSRTWPRSASSPTISAAPAAGAERRASIWPHVEERVLDLVEAHRSTIVFANSRRLAERLTARLNELATERAGRVLGDPTGSAGRADGPGRFRPPGERRGRRPAHHGSVSREQRVARRGGAQGRPAAGGRRDVLSLELGIDMGAVDLVVQVESPPSVASGLQRVGRAGHQVGAVSRGVIFPKYRGDLVECAVVAERMRAGPSSRCAIPRNPLDVLAQQIVAMVALDTAHGRRRGRARPPRRAVRRAAPLGARGDARHAGRAVPLRRVRRAAPAPGLGPRHRAS